MNLKKNKKKFDKYWYYRHSVQSPEQDVRFIENCYRTLCKKRPFVFREDFAFTFALCCAWVKLSHTHKAIAIDRDKKPLSYSKKHYLPLLKPKEQQRVSVINSNVLKKNLPRADIIAALNFSYFVFKKREEMKKYFTHCRKALNKKGLLVLDCFGGSQCFQANEDKEVYNGFNYYWDQVSFDPISHHSLFRIHYKRRGENKRYNVFTYDWRLWTIPELKDILQEVGFRKTHIYWEGSKKDGSGNGRFKIVKKGEECEAWVAYIMAEK